MHAPIAGDYVNGTWKDGLSLAAADDGRRKAAVDETLATLDVAARGAVQDAGRALRRARAIRGARATTTAARWFAASKSCRRSPLATACAWPIEVIPNELSTPSALVELIESDIDAQDSASAWTSATRG